MSDADAGATEDPNMTTITLKIPQAFLDDLDATWRAEDFPSRSEFIRWALRDTVKHPTFSRKGWKDIAARLEAHRSSSSRVREAAAARAGAHRLEARRDRDGSVA